MASKGERRSKEASSQGKASLSAPSARCHRDHRAADGFRRRHRATYRRSSRTRPKENGADHTERSRDEPGAERLVHRIRVRRHGGRPGDRIFFMPGENHWHGAAPTRFMTHIAMQQADEDGNVVAWGQHVTDEEYGKAPAIDGGRRKP